MKEINKEIPQVNTGVIFLFYKEGQILVEDRPGEDLAYPNMTIIPGGKIKFREGETPHQALRREIAEEMGNIEIINMYDLGEFCDFTGRGNLQKPRAYLITSYTGEIENIEADKGKHRWIDIGDYDNELPLSTSKLIVERAIKILSNPPFECRQARVGG